ncbi:MAG: 5-formyltetrahydrofolate cyclo-ligase [Deltaproteobacteria bacterium]|nr:5-formyltetrahydrofolate cyclo-ligase [Deltaproteobacteria bacterium]
MSVPESGTDDLTRAKAELRARLRAIRRALGPAHRRAASRAICERLGPILEARRAPVVAVYAPLGSEVDLRPLVAAQRDTITFVWPRVDRALGLVFHAADLADLAPGTMGIREPPRDAPVTVRVDVALVPGLGFDRAGGRLGQGGGYYDRALPELRRACPDLLVIGVAFAAQVVDALPVGPHDARVDLVVTEDGPLGPFDDKARAP